MPTSGSRLARGLRVWFDVVLVLSGLAMGLLALWLVISPLAMAGGARESEAAVAVAVGAGPLRPVLPVRLTTSQEGLFSTPRLVRGRGQLRFSTSNWRLQFLTNVSLLIGALVALYGVLLVRNPLRDVGAGQPFGPTNARRLRILGVLFLVVGVLRPAVEYALGSLVLSRIVSVEPVLSPPLAFQRDAIVAGLLLLVLAQVWRHGSELEEDQSLTV
jgi:hypothetical protein